ncbi:hypothetical protein RND71_000143 [Anisodus tanguticus]|uniref:Uncharacterized protein n=1 Tax=Anisodus tanguticus TaxID=243964 RepID=A0AAE1VUZ6_9SOLA|nr:hypothetical protein RND71_000143 [Anisodus tanguticus]
MENYYFEDSKIRGPHMAPCTTLLVLKPAAPTRLLFELEVHLDKKEYHATKEKKRRLNLEERKVGYAIRRMKKYVLVLSVVKSNLTENNVQHKRLIILKI